MKQLFGNLTGLKANQLKRLNNLYRRRTPPQYLISPELAKAMAALSHEIGRQIGVVVERNGKIRAVLVGDNRQILIPEFKDVRLAPGRLRGFRVVHTHLGTTTPGLDPDDLTDLALLRLDMMAAFSMTPDGLPHQFHLGHILPGIDPRNPYRIWPPFAPRDLDIDCQQIILALEAELESLGAKKRVVKGQERALLVSVSSKPKAVAQDSIDELRELARSAGIHILGTVSQYRAKPDARWLMGKGKLMEISILSLQRAATLIIFDQELNASQIRALTDRIELKIIDRNQLILDIFAQRAQTREGKLQVELAQLRYILPRLVTKNTAMSRLTGGIGGRGPGETKLEINRRRVRQRIAQLEKLVNRIGRQRGQQKARRDKKGLPILSIVGYTNAGKSTLLNSLTQSRVLAEDRLFATLDPASRRLRFPRDIEVIITDTVGFIRDLPKDLTAAFRATLEELAAADLLLHVIDISNPRHEEQIKAVEKILSDLGLGHIRTLRVLNKQDLVAKNQIPHLVQRWDGTAISAHDRSSLHTLLERIESCVLRMPRLMDKRS